MIVVVILFVPISTFISIVIVVVIVIVTVIDTRLAIAFASLPHPARLLSIEFKDDVTYGTDDTRPRAKRAGAARAPG